jgi:DNA repair protein RecO (recombination protein O)
MTGSYDLTGIVLQKKPFGENDLLVTILSPDLGLVRGVAPGARKHKSRLRGRTELLVVNHFFLIQGRSIDRITQIETIESYPKLSQSIGKLAVSQYLAELVLNLALREQPQSELYTLLREHLRRIENLSTEENLFPYLAQAIFHLLAVTGIAPNVHSCIYCQKAIEPQFQQQNWQIGFSFQGGGIIKNNFSSTNKIDRQINALELAILQSLGNSDVSPLNDITSFQFHQLLIEKSWIRVERMLKDYLEFYLGKVLKSAEIITDVLIAF